MFDRNVASIVKPAFSPEDETHSYRVVPVPVTLQL